MRMKAGLVLRCILAHIFSAESVHKAAAPSPGAADRDKCCACLCAFSDPSRPNTRELLPSWNPISRCCRWGQSDEVQIDRIPMMDWTFACGHHEDVCIACGERVLRLTCCPLCRAELRIVPVPAAMVMGPSALSAAQSLRVPLLQRAGGSTQQQSVEAARCPTRCTRVQAANPVVGCWMWFRSCCGCLC